MKEGIFKILTAVLVCCAAFPLWLPGTARAEDLVVGFVGIVYYVEDQWGCNCIPYESISIGDTLRGYYVYNSDTPDSNPNPNVGSYNHDTYPCGIVMYIGDYVFSSDRIIPDFLVELTDSVDPGGSNPFDDDDTYDARSVRNQEDPFQPGQYLYWIFFTLRDYSGLALTCDSLDASPPILDLWSHGGAYIYGASLGYEIGAEITSIDLGPPSGMDPASRPRLDITNYPNPFNPATTIRYSIRAGSDVVIRIYNVRGRLVRTLVDEFVEPGEHVKIWDGTDADGRQVASGVYFCRLHSGDVSLVRKLVLVR